MLRNLAPSLRAFIWAIFIALILMTGCQKQGGTPQVAPEFSLSDINGRTASLAEHRGQVVLLDFWATWCPPCRMSIPELVRLQEKYKDKGLVVLGVSLDDPAEFTNEYIQAFKDKFNINYRILRFNMQVVKDYFGYDAPTIPTLFVIDRDGKVRDRIVGFVPNAAERVLTGLLEG
jgi:thiol-disulfide isomerase/thioredoxin